MRTSKSGWRNAGSKRRMKLKCVNCLTSTREKEGLKEGPREEPKEGPRELVRD